MKPGFSHLPAFGLVAFLGLVAASRAEAVEQPTPQAVLNSVGAIQTTANNLQTDVHDIQSTLDRVPPAWSQALPAAVRFVPVLGGVAELDMETGLVWERSPSTSTFTWLNA
jgi:hypothetical protein